MGRHSLPKVFFFLPLLPAAVVVAFALGGISTGEYAGLMVLRGWEKVEQAPNLLFLSLYLLEYLPCFAAVSVYMLRECDLGRLVAILPREGTRIRWYLGNTGSIAGYCAYFTVVLYGVTALADGLLGVTGLYQPVELAAAGAMLLTELLLTVELPIAIGQPYQYLLPHNYGLMARSEALLENGFSIVLSLSVLGALNLALWALGCCLLPRLGSKK